MTPPASRRGTHAADQPPSPKRGQLFVVGHEKGGMGKSSLSANLAVACAMQGQDVVLIDTDRSRANASWGKIRSQGDPGLAKVTVIEAPTNPLVTIRDLVERYDVMVVDLAAGDYMNLPELALIADLLIVPTGVGREALESTVKVHNTMRALDSRHKRGRIPMVCIFNCVRHIPKEEAAAREELSQACPDLAICPTTIYDRKVFRDVSWIGKSILEMPKRESERAVEEFTKAMKYAFAQAKRLSASTSGDPVEAKKPRRNERRTTSPTMEAGS
jgi:chromosome partitioning protein